MPWDTLRKALDWLLESGHAEPVLGFLGGEPLLELPMLRRAVDHVGRRAPPGMRVGYAISTNGTLLDDEAALFLAANRVRTQISSDGVLDAQEQRAPGTFASLDRLLLRLRRDHPQYLKECVSVRITLTYRNLHLLAASVRYLLQRQVPRISILPLETPDPDWRTEAIAELDSQIAQVFAASEDHERRSGERPVVCYRPRGRRRPWRQSLGGVCGADAGDRAVVAADGRVFGCPAVLGVARAADAPLWRDTAAGLDFGRIGQAGLTARVEDGAAALRHVAVFCGRERRHSVYARCRDCRFIGECRICPLSIAAASGNSDPYRVPDAACAWNLVTGAWRERRWR